MLAISRFDLLSVVSSLPGDVLAFFFALFVGVFF
jgi:hypothetical protein